MWLSSNNAGVTNPSASASRAGWYGEGGHDCCEAYQKDESSKVRELASESRLRASTCTLHPSQVAICGARTQADCAVAPKIRIDRAWLEFQLRNILAFRAAHDVPVWIVRTPPFKQPRPNSVLMMCQPTAPSPPTHRRPTPLPPPRSSVGPVRSTRGRARRDGSRRALPRRGARALRGRGAPLDLLAMAASLCRRPERHRGGAYPPHRRRLGLRRLRARVPADRGRAIPTQRASALRISLTHQVMPSGSRNSVYLFKMLMSHVS